MNHHDPTGCHLADCQRCEDYAIGYQAGKDKALFEIEVFDDFHVGSCACAPCRIIRGIIAREKHS